jgi:hypothetical protein
MRTIATLLGTVAMALAAIGLAVAAPGGDHELARAELQAASGAVHIANSHAGQALFAASGMRPGQSVSGTVTIGNDGDARGSFALVATGVQDSAGPYGGLLSGRLQLQVLDTTDPQNPVTLYAGGLAGFGGLDLGALGPGDRRDYRVQATLPDGGAPGSAGGGDNRFQGSSTSLGLEWRAAQIAVPTPTPEPPAAPVTPVPPAVPVTPAPPAPTPAPAPAPTPASPTGEALADALGLPAARTCIKKRRLTLRLKAPAGAKIVSATIKVNGRVKARLKGAKARKPVNLRGLGPRTTKLIVSLRASNGRTYTVTRTYRACKR